MKKKILSVLISGALLFGTVFVNAVSIDENSNPEAITRITEILVTETIPHIHTGDSVNGGGCYNIPEYHVHTGNSTSGEGCYTVGTHIHNSSCSRHHHTGISHVPIYQSGNGCYGYMNLYSPHWISGCPLDCWHETWSNGCHGWCTNCGWTWDDDTNGRTVCINTQYDYNCILICGKSEGQYECNNAINYWNLGCGKNANTIESYKCNISSVDTIEIIKNIDSRYTLTPVIKNINGECSIISCRWNNENTDTCNVTNNGLYICTVTYLDNGIERTFKIETNTINYYCTRNKYPVTYIDQTTNRTELSRSMIQML